MSGIGKLLTFVNLFVALVLLAWATSLYANQPPWLDTKTEQETIEGEITRMKKEIDRLTRSISDTHTAYGTKAAALAQIEARRDYRQRKYAERLRAAQDGRFKVQLPLANDRAYVDVDREGPDILDAENKPLRGVKALAAEFKRQVDLAQEQRRGTRPVEDWNTVNVADLLMPDRLAELGIDDLRQLHGRLSDRVQVVGDSAAKQKTILDNLRAEADYLADQRVNWIVQLQTLERRQQQLEERLRDLGAAAATARID